MTHPLRKPVTGIPVEHRTLHRPLIARRADFALTATVEPEPQIPKLSLSNVSLSYATNSSGHLVALKNINLQVQPGEFLCIVGP